MHYKIDHCKPTPNDLQHLAYGEIFKVNSLLIYIFLRSLYYNKCIKYYNFPWARPLTGQTPQARLKQWKKANIQQQ